MANERTHMLVEHDETTRIRAFMCARRAHGGTFGPWSGARSDADQFTKAEAERAAAEWNDYAASKGAMVRYAALPLSHTGRFLEADQ